MFLPHRPIFDLLGNTICDNEATVILCQSVLFIFGGYSCEHMNASRIPVYISNMPAGTSIWNLEHWGQVRIGNVVFRRYLFLGPHFNLSINTSRIPIYISIMPVGTSIWNLEHWGQERVANVVFRRDLSSVISFNECVETVLPLVHSGRSQTVGFNST